MPGRADHSRMQPYHPASELWRGGGWGSMGPARFLGLLDSARERAGSGPNIAMGFIDAALCEPGTEVSVDLGRKEHAARIVPLPFYKRPK